VPEKYESTITVRPDGSYNYKFDGTVADLASLIAIKYNGQLTQKDEDALAKRAQSTKKGQAIRSLRYVGNGRFEAVVDADSSASEVHAIPGGLMAVRRSKDGTFTISAPVMKPKDVEELKSMGVKPNGVIRVLLPADANVESHNASGTPGLLSKAYTWRVTSLEDMPRITFKLKS